MSVRMREYTPAYQWFGGKAPVADVVWSRFGKVNTYVEPFFGSGAVLLCAEEDECRTETVNDLDGYVANFWRAVQADPEAVAKWANWPCNEVDLNARHVWLTARKAEFSERIWADPDFYDPKYAGWWCWGLTWWIGGDWCDPGSGPWVSDGVRLFKETGQGVSRKRPHLVSDGQGVSRRRPHLGNDGQGVSRKRPHLVNEGRGVSRRRPRGLCRTACGVSRDAEPSEGIGQCELYSAWIRKQIADLSDRLRRVRVCSGDWSRVVKPSVTGVLPSTGNSVCAVFLDPPYSAEANRDANLYATDCLKVAHDVREWAIANGENKRYRIALCGYEGEHAMPENWETYEWKANGGMANQSKEGQGQANARRERIWFSPFCVKPVKETDLFGEME